MCSVDTGRSSVTGTVVGWEKGKVEAEAAGRPRTRPTTNPQMMARSMVGTEVVKAQQTLEGETAPPGGSVAVARS